MTYRPYSTIKASGIELSYKNVSGGTIGKGIPVKINSAGDVSFIDVSIEADVFALGGVTSGSAANNANVPIVMAGRVENITTSFTFGDAVYIDKTGFLTNIKPSDGVNSFGSGDYIVRVGTIAKNTTNPLLYDLVLELNLIGQIG